MKMTQKALVVAIATVMGASAAVVSTSASAVVADGSYAMTIVTTPTYTTWYGNTAFKIGIDGAWQSSFTFGTFPSNTSQGMTDNNTQVQGTDGNWRGSGVIDTFAGNISVSVAGGVITGPGNMSGSVDLTTGLMDFTPTDRLGAITAPNSLYDLAFNIDDANCDTTGCTSNGNTVYNDFTTGTHTGPAGAITGSNMVNAGDIDGDLIDDYSGILVSGGTIGSAWGGFFGAAYYETWRIQMLTGTAASGFNVDTIFGTAGGDFAQYTSAVPVPAAVWLFGSGLMGLVGVARRKKS